LDYEEVLAERKKERRREKVNKGLKIAFYVIYITVYLGTISASIIYAIVKETPRETLFLIGGVIILLAIIGLLILVPSFISQKAKKNKKWEQKIDELALDEEKPKEAKESFALAKFQSGLTKAIRISGKELDLKKLDWRKTKALLYEGEITEEKCAICKLAIEVEEYVMQCPECQSLYHGEHLVEWLIEQGTCPVCRTTLL
jgi:hypothetical protein